MPLDPLRHAFDNGVTALIKETHTTPSVTILAGIRAGAFYDPPGREGTAALTARVLDRGTTSRTAASIADELDCRGASLSVMAGRHQVTVSATCLAEDFEAIFGLVADVVQRPSFSPDELVTRRTELLTSILQDEDDPGAVAIDTLLARLYPTHPYGRRGRGTAASVAGLEAADLVAFHQRWFSPIDTVLVVVGDVEAHRVLSSVAVEFAGWNSARAAETPLVDAEPAAERQMTAMPMPNKAQADIAYGFVGLRRSDPDFYAAWVMNNALGQFALGGRLGDSIRERQGMAYYVYSTLDASLARGPFIVRAGVSADHVERTLASIDSELRLVGREGLMLKELDESKRYLVGSIPRQLETNAGIAGFLLSVEFYRLGTDYDARLPGLLSSVSLDEANAIAARLLDADRATIVVAGPWQAPAASEFVVLSPSDATAAAGVASGRRGAGPASTP